MAKAALSAAAAKGKGLPPSAALKRGLPVASTRKPTTFELRVYQALVDKVPQGSVTTYAALAELLQTSPRAVGGALRRNPYAPQVPCHRVVSSDGKLGGFCGETEAGSDALQRKRELLTREGVSFDEEAASCPAPTGPTVARACVMRALV